MSESGAVCGLLCQHPSCWLTQNRRKHHKPHNPSRHSAIHVSRSLPVSRSLSLSEDEEEGLPTQKIINLLSDYGEDPADRFPAGTTYTHSSSDLSSQKTRINSFNRVQMVTPASLLHSSSIHIGHMTPLTHAQPVEASAPKLKKVEVQEVFDPDDLQSQWHDTFIAGKYYVWMPNTARNNKKQSVKQTGPLSDSRGSILPRDVTELMVPHDISWERHSKHMRRNITSPRSPQQGLHTHGRGHSNREYYGIYQLLDLPREVLVKVLDHVDQRDLVDQERLTEALTRAFPKLETENSTLSMAYGEVLKQRKIRLRDDRPQKRLPIPVGTPQPPRQIYLLDVGQTNDDDLCLPPDVKPKCLLLDIEQSANHQSVLTSPNKVPSKKHEMPRKALLPSIPSEQETEKIKLASVSLGLPQLPSGVKITRPFNYKEQDFDFTLGPVSYPLLFESPKTPKRTSKLKQRSPSPITSDKSSIVVTMPTINPDAPSIRKREFTQSTCFGFVNDCVWDTDTRHRPLHAVSPALSTNVPKAPVGTPSVPLYGSFLRDHSSTLPARPRDHPATSADSGRVIPVTGISIPKPNFLAQQSPEITGGLHTIKELEPEEHAPQPADYRLRADLLRSHNNVRFAMEVRQPPSSPNTSERSDSTNTQSRAGVSPKSLANHAYSPDILRVVHDEPLRDGRASSPDAGWPDVDEQAIYDKPPTPFRPPTMSSSADTDQSLTAQFDQGSDILGLASAMPSRESTFMSGQRLLERLEESPGPPPPSPDAKDADKSFKLPPAARSSGTRIDTFLEELMDSDLEMSISAKPPSNLDDYSRIQTPATPQRTDRSATFMSNRQAPQSHDPIPEGSVDGKSETAPTPSDENRQNLHDPAGDTAPTPFGESFKDIIGDLTDENSSTLVSAESKLDEGSSVIAEDALFDLDPEPADPVSEVSDGRRDELLAPPAGNVLRGIQPQPPAYPAVVIDQSMGGSTRPPTDYAEPPVSDSPEPPREHDTEPVSHDITEQPVVDTTLQPVDGTTLQPVDGTTLQPVDGISDQPDIQSLNILEQLDNSEDTFQSELKEELGKL